MPLPKIIQPLFNITIPSTGVKTTFRPFTVKEEKILLIAQESKDANQIMLAVKQIVNNCVTNINIDKLAMFDLEYLLLMLRAKSVGNEIEFEVIDPDTEEKVKLKVDVESIEVTKKKNHNNKIDLDDNYVLIMRYPSIEDANTINKESQAESLLKLMLSCVDVIASKDGEEVFKLSDFTDKEVNDFLDNMSSSAIKKIQEFFSTMPVLKLSVPYKNSKGDSKTFVIEGVESFFI